MFEGYLWRYKVLLGLVLERRNGLLRHAAECRVRSYDGYLRKAAALHVQAGMLREIVDRLEQAQARVSQEIISQSHTASPRSNNVPG